jgi:hypothetical protein
MVNYMTLEVSIFFHLFQNIREVFICIAPSCNCFTVCKKNDCAKIRFHQENRKRVFVNTTFSANFGCAGIIAWHSNLTLTLRSWIIIVELTFTISDDIINTFSPIAIELFEHFQATNNTVLFLSFSQKMRHPTTCNLP